jgi:hypothetical protein
VDCSGGGGLDQGSGFEEGFDAGQECGQAVGLGDDGSNAKRGGKLLAENVAEHGVDDEWGAGQSGAEQRGSLDTIHVGHGKIQDDEIGLKGAGFFDRFGAIGGFAANLEAGIVLEEHTNGIAYGDFVLDDEDAFGHETRGNIARRLVKESRVNPVLGLRGRAAERYGSSRSSTKLSICIGVKS